MAKVKQSDLDTWGDHVEEYSKRQKQLHQELVNKKLMEITDEDLKIMDEINNTFQTKTRWTENKRWLAAVIGLLCVVGFVSVLFVYNLFWHALAGVLGVWLLGMLLVASKDLVDDLIDGW